MQLHDNVTMKGELKIVVTGRDGKIKQTLVVPNLVVTTGKQYIASRMVGTSANVMSHMALGDGSATPVVGNTTLGSELGRVALISFASTGNTVTATAAFPAGIATGALSEAGILNASTGGTLLSRTTFPVVNKEAGDAIAISWTITVS